MSDYSKSKTLLQYPLVDTFTKVYYQIRLYKAKAGVKICITPDKNAPDMFVIIPLGVANVITDVANIVGNIQNYCLKKLSFNIEVNKPYLKKVVVESRNPLKYKSLKRLRPYSKKIIQDALENG